MAFFFLTIYYATHIILIFTGLGATAPLIDNVPNLVPAWKLAWHFFLVGCVEECVFRYVLQDRILGLFIKRWHWIAILIAAIAFGAMHFMNPGDWIYNLPQVMGATAAGLYLGKKYRERSLLFVILVHGGYDFLITVLS